MRSGRRRTAWRAACAALAVAALTVGIGACSSHTDPSRGATWSGPTGSSASPGAPTTGAGDAGPSPQGGVTAQDLARAAATAAKLSDIDLVGQTLVPYAFGQDANQVSVAAVRANQRIGGVSTPAQLITKYRLGGMVLVNFSSGDPTASTNATTNITSASQVHTLTSGMQAAAAKLPAAVPLLIGTDQEYGVVNRLRSGIVQLPSAMAIGAAGEPALTLNAWAAAGGDLAAVGVNVDFAPDADVIAKSGNTVIGSRSFGGVPANVSKQVEPPSPACRAPGSQRRSSISPGTVTPTPTATTRCPCSASL